MKRFDYYGKTKKYLQAEPKARMVENRATAVWNLVKMYVNPNLDTLEKVSFVKYWPRFHSFDRAVRMVQNECPDLRHEGNIKNQELEVDKLKELGYM